MTLPTSGSLSLSQIQTECGGVNPISLSEYYKGGPYIGAASTSKVPSSGAISISQFQGVTGDVGISFATGTPSKSGNITLAANAVGQANLDLTRTGGSNFQGALATQGTGAGKSTGKWFAQFYCINNAGNDPIIGIGDLAEVMDTTGFSNAPGDANGHSLVMSVNYYAKQTDSRIQGGNIPSPVNQYMQPAYLGTYINLAIDLDNRMVWFKPNNSSVPWNFTDSTADPASNTGGFGIGATWGNGSAVTYLLMGGFASQHIGELRSRSGSFAPNTTIPSGFNAWG